MTLSDATAVVGATVPYVAAVVELDGTNGAGARLVANPVDCQPDVVARSDRARVVFDQLSPTLALPRVVFLPPDQP
jgi:hypothetical protein